MRLTRRAVCSRLAGAALAAACGSRREVRPNIVLAMADDLGWGDTGYNSHPFVRTPNLDEMARRGVRFDRFYAGAPVCSPTRGSCLTGRHPFRYGITWALGHGQSREEQLRPREVTLAEVLRDSGYATGHFGKWHLGVENGVPTPGKHGFEEWFSTEKKVPTYNPGATSDGPYFHNGKRASENLDGDDSRVLMDRAVPFLEGAVRAKRPFLAVIWFHSPHLPVLAGPEHRRLYAGHPEPVQHYYGAVTAMDEQIGRLRKVLRELGASQHTMLWFASDNGPEGDRQSEAYPGSAGRFRGRKRSLFEGGIRVPALLEWPARIREPRVTSVAVSTSDFYPTVLDLLGQRPAEQPEPLDGISLVPLLDGHMRGRPRPIAFETQGDRRVTRGSPRLALIGEPFKLLTDLDGGEDQLYDLVRDPEERINLAAARPAVVDLMRRQLERWRESCHQSAGSS